MCQTWRQTRRYQYENVEMWKWLVGVRIISVCKDTLQGVSATLPPFEVFYTIIYSYFTWMKPPRRNITVPGVRWLTAKKEVVLRLNRNTSQTNLGFYVIRFSCFLRSHCHPNMFFVRSFPSVLYEFQHGHIIISMTAVCLLMMQPLCVDPLLTMNRNVCNKRLWWRWQEWQSSTPSGLAARIHRL